MRREAGGVGLALLGSHDVDAVTAFNQRIRRHANMEVGTQSQTEALERMCSMAGRDKQSADKTKAKAGRLKLKKETVRDLTAGEAARKVRGGGIRTGTCR
jgi:hypothetical protein